MQRDPELQQHRGISPIWSLPLLALIICGWILFRSLQNAGIPIQVYFDDASGITAGKTQVFIRGIPVGTVTGIVPDLKNHRIRTLITMDKSVEDQLVSDSLFWIVRPEISAASVQGLDTLLGGSYIGFQPGQAKESAKIFTGETNAPPIAKDTPGLHLRLHAQDMGSIQVGSEVSYHNIPIGSVTKTGLDPADNSPCIEIFIKQKYMELVRRGSRFYNASGLSVSGKLTNLKVHLQSLTSLIKGGIVLYTPEGLEATEAAHAGQEFTLFQDAQSAKYSISMTLQLSSSTGITEGITQVLYRGMVVGIVAKIQSNEDTYHTVTAHIMLDPRVENILRSGTQFWTVSPEVSLQKINNLDALLSGPYITFTPGTGTYQNHFISLVKAPAEPPLRPGTTFHLSSTSSYGLTQGAPVTYKKMKVGEIFAIDLNAALRRFDFSIFIYTPYEKLIDPQSVFWNDSGVELKASLSKVELRTDSLSSLVNGGISFITPEDSAKKGALQPKSYPLYADFDEATQQDPSLKPAGYTFELTSAGDENIPQGTPIFYKNIEVGKILALSLSADGRTRILTAFVKAQFRATINASTRFYNISGVEVQGDLSGVRLTTPSLQSIITGGISYVTPAPEEKKPAQASFHLYHDRADSLNVDTALIHVSFSSCDKLQKGSPVKYKGVEIGSVDSLNFASNLKDIDAVLRISNKALPFFRTGTRIWLEDAQISFSGIKNLQSVLFGPYVNIQPGKGHPTTHFTALSTPPTTSTDQGGGMQVILTSSRLGSLRVGSPLYYRQIKIGQILSYELSENFQHVLINVEIEKNYAPLIRENTKFWKVSGTHIQGGIFSGISVSTESMEALLTGGIALATPDNGHTGGPIAEGHYFPLFDKVDPAWLEWQPDMTLVEQKDKQASFKRKN